MRFKHSDLIDLFEDGTQLKISSQIQLPLAEVIRDNLGYFYYRPPKKQARRTLSSRSFLSPSIFKRQLLVLKLICTQARRRRRFFCCWLSSDQFSQRCYKKYKKFMNSKLPNWHKPAQITDLFYKLISLHELYKMTLAVIYFLSLCICSSWHFRAKIALFIFFLHPTHNKIGFSFYFQKKKSVNKK